MTRTLHVFPVRFGHLLRFGLAFCFGSSLVVVGCGGGTRPIELTEPWTSGDERALGIEEPDEAEDGSGSASAGETAPVDASH